MIDNGKTQIDEYALLDLFGDKEIKVFTTLGRTLKGKILSRTGRNILVLETQTNRQAYINLDYIISVTGDNQ
jgi:hypothetical protein